MLNFFFPLIEPFGLLFGIDFTCGSNSKDRTVKGK